MGKKVHVCHIIKSKSHSSLFVHIKNENVVIGNDDGVQITFKK